MWQYVGCDSVHMSVPAKVAGDIHPQAPGAAATDSLQQLSRQYILHLTGDGSWRMSPSQPGTWSWRGYMCGSRGGIGGQDPPPPPPGKSQVVWVYIEISIWTPPSPLENVGPPLDPWKYIVFSVIKPFYPLCKQ